ALIGCSCFRKRHAAYLLVNGSVICFCANQYFSGSELNNNFRDEKKQVREIDVIGQATVQRLQFIFKVVAKMPEQPVVPGVVKSFQLIECIAGGSGEDMRSAG